MFNMILLKTFLTHSFFRLDMLHQPYIGPCLAACVQSHQRQPMSAVALATWEVKVSADDSHTTPIVVTVVSKPLYCRLTLTFTLTSVNQCESLYNILLLYLSLYNNYTCNSFRRTISLFSVYLKNKVVWVF